MKGATLQLEDEYYEDLPLPHDGITQLAYVIAALSKKCAALEKRIERLEEKEAQQ